MFDMQIKRKGHSSSMGQIQKITGSKGSKQRNQTLDLLI